MALESKFPLGSGDTAEIGLLNLGPHSIKHGHHHSHPHFHYQTLAATVVVTGVRADSATSDAVIVTGTLVSGGESIATVYRGSLHDIASAPSSSWDALTPVFAGQTVTSSTFYGPNTPLYDPSLPSDEFRAVGSYKYYPTADGPGSEDKYDHGMMYVGPTTGNGNSGTWTQLDATSLLHPGQTLLNTIAHSTMGDLVVGNYDTDAATGHAFIYDITDGHWREMNPAHSLSITAYGIWHNGGSSSTSYTITGGYSNLDHHGVDAGYLVDYDSATHRFSHFKSFEYRNLSHGAPVSHFDGISATKNGYVLTGEYLLGPKPGGFFAEVTRNSDGSFGKAHWLDVSYPKALVTTGNTVIDDTVLGIYLKPTKTGVESHSYVATLHRDHHHDLEAHLHLGSDGHLAHVLIDA